MCVWVGICAYVQIAMCMLVCVGRGVGTLGKPPTSWAPSWAPVTPGPRASRPSVALGLLKPETQGTGVLVMYRMFKHF